MDRLRYDPILDNVSGTYKSVMAYLRSGTFVGPRPPAFVDLDWMRRNTFTTGVDIATFVQHAQGLRDDVGAVFAGCRKRDDFLSRLLENVHRLEVAASARMMFGDYGAAPSRTLFGPLLVRAHEALYGRNCPPMDASDMRGDIVMGMHKLLNAPDTRGIGLDALAMQCIFFSPELVFDLWSTLQEKTHDVPEWLAPYRDNATALAERVYEANAEKASEAAEAFIPDAVVEEPEPSDLQEFFDRKWVEENFDPYAAFGLFSDPDIVDRLEHAWNRMGDLVALAEDLRQARLALSNPTASVFGGALAPLDRIASRYRIPARLGHLDPRLATVDLALGKGHRKDLRIAQGALFALLTRPLLDPDIRFVVKRHADDVGPLFDLCAARLDVEGEPDIFEEIDAPTPPPPPVEKPPAPEEPAAEVASAEPETDIDRQVTPTEEESMIHAIPTPAVPETSRWHELAQALADAVRTASDAEGNEAREAAIASIHERLRDLEAGLASPVDPWAGFDAMLDDLAAIEPRVRGKADAVRNVAGLLSADRPAVGPDLRSLRALVDAATSRATLMLGLYERLQAGFDADLAQETGAASKDAASAYEVAYDAIALALSGEVPSQPEAVVEPATVEVEVARTVAPVEPVVVREETPAETKAVAEPIAQIADPAQVSGNLAWNEASTRLFRAGSFALAYHLALAAERAGSPVPVSSSELRLAAVAGHLSLSTINVTGMPAEVRDAVAGTLALTETNEFGSGTIGNARRLLAFAGAIEAALIGRDHAAMAIVEGISLDAAWNEAAFPLKEATRAAGKGGQSLTVELFKGLRDAEESRRDLEAARRDVKDSCAFLRRQSFPTFQTGTKTVLALTAPAGEVGSLAIQIDGNPTQSYNAAKRFAQAYSAELSVDGLIQRAKDGIVAHSREKRANITGKVRNSMVGAIQTIAENCAAYVAARDAASEIEGGKRTHYEEIRNRLLHAISSCASATQERIRKLPANGPEAIAADAVLAALTRLRGILDGDVRTPGPHDHLLALHAPLACVPGLRHGGGWFATETDPAKVADAIATHATHGALDVEACFHACLAVGATSSARILADHAKAMGLPSAATMPEAIASAIETLRPQVTGRLDAARRALENIERSGDPAEQEEAALLADRLDLIDLARLPIEIETEARMEEPDAKSLVVDFAGVTEVVDGILARGHAMNARRREEMHAELDQVAGEGRISSDTIAQVRRIVDEDDLVYASEWIANLQAGVEVPDDRRTEGPFAAFFPAVPAFLARAGASALSEAASFAESGEAHGPLAFDRIGAGRRAAARDFLLAYENLGKVVRQQGASSAPAILRNLMECLGRLGIVPVGMPENLDHVGSAATRALTFQVGLDVPQDETSMVLPDFGSQTLGRWNVMVSQTLPSEQEIAKFLSNGAIGGNMVVVTGLVGVEERRKLAQTCREQRRKILVVDQAVIAAAAAEPALRAASIIELAQPFSFATPFRDHGRGAVPPEMYVGRRQEMSLIVDPVGPCVVYGARRNGKTATLLHVAATHHSSKSGFVAVQISVQGIGKSEGGKVDDVWQKISAAMPDVFKTPVADRDSFGEGVRRFLDAKTSRRILLMLDECDDVIEKDAENGFQAFLTLQELMESTRRRFKVVFAGLRNVTRLVRDGNAPLKHIASNPIRIGPFVGVELAEAERLVTKPFSAMGYRFASRDLVWRMLARANYAPGLVQVMCERVLEFLRARPFDPRNNPPMLIDDAVVRDALADPVVMEAVAKTFFISIEYDRRYVLLANVVANADIGRADAGILAEGMTLAEIHREATSYWPALFGGVDGLALVEDTVDEMEGLGLLKRVEDDRWALRSPSIRRLLGSRDSVESRLEGFLTIPPSVEFDFRSNRKSIALPGSTEPDHLSPLTGTQIARIQGGRFPIMVASGCAASDLDLIAPALTTDAGGYRGRISRVTALKAPSEVASALQAACAQPGEQLFVVGPEVKWDIEWVRAAASTAFGRPRMTGNAPEVRILFVADPRRSLSLIDDKNPLVGIDWVLPRPWSEGMLDRAGEKYGVTLIGDERQAFSEVTGNLNGLATSALRSIAGSSDKGAALRDWFARESAREGFLPGLGILPPLAPWFSQAGELVGMGEDLTVEMVGELLDGCKRPRRFVRYATRMGLASTSKDAAGNAFVVFNPLLRTLAKAR